jgi:hypothetical protein
MGFTSERSLDITHWSDGGTTSVSNSACLCQYHHTLVHEGGYRIQAVANNDQRMNERFSMQQRKDDVSMFSFEKELRNDRNSFNRVRQLAMTRYRFRIVNADGQEIRVFNSAFICQSANCTESTGTPNPAGTFYSASASDTANTINTANTSNLEIQSPLKGDNPYLSIHNHSTRVECGEPVSAYNIYVEPEWCNVKIRHALQI